LHDFLQGVYTKAEYQKALDADQDTRARAVRRQTEGRLRARKTESA
jgi:hypothetical protein